MINNEILIRLIDLIKITNKDAVMRLLNRIEYSTDDKIINSSLICIIEITRNLNKDYTNILIDKIFQRLSYRKILISSTVMNRLNDVLDENNNDLLKDELNMKHVYSTLASLAAESQLICKLAMKTFVIATMDKTDNLNILEVKYIIAMVLNTISCDMEAMELIKKADEGQFDNNVNTSVTINELISNA